MTGLDSFLETNNLHLRHCKGATSMVSIGGPVCFFFAMRIGPAHKLRSSLTHEVRKSFQHHGLKIVDFDVNNEHKTNKQPLYQKAEGMLK